MLRTESAFKKILKMLLLLLDKPYKMWYNTRTESDGLPDGKNFSSEKILDKGRKMWYNPTDPSTHPTAGSDHDRIRANKKVPKDLDT